MWTYRVGPPSSSLQKGHITDPRGLRVLSHKWSLNWDLRDEWDLCKERGKVCTDLGFISIQMADEVRVGIG